MPCLPFPVRSQVRSAGVSSVFSLFPKRNDPPTPLHASKALSLVSVNVNGLRDADKRLTLLQWLSHLSPSVVCLQETHALSSDKLCVWFSRFGDEHLLHNKQDLNKQFRGCYSQLKKPCSTHSSKPFFLSCYILYLCCAILQRVSQNMYTQTACALQPHVNFAHRSMNDITIIIVGMSFVLLENEHITFFYSMCDIKLCVEALCISCWSLYSLSMINF